MQSNRDMFNERHAVIIIFLNSHHMLKRTTFYLVHGSRF